MTANIDGAVMLIAAGAVIYFTFIAPMTGTMRSKRRTAMMEEKSATLRYQMMQQRADEADRRSSDAERRQQERETNFRKPKPVAKPKVVEIVEEEATPDQVLTPEVSLGKARKEPKSQKDADMQYYMQISSEMDNRDLH